jgi:Zn-dependent metalloprotease
VAVARANEAIAANRDAVRASAEDRYLVWRVIVMPNGAAHVRYTREFRGLPVIGGDFVVHLAPDGGFAGVSVSLDQAIGIGTDAKLSSADAARAARDSLRATDVGTPQLVVDAVGGVARLAWQAPATTAEGGVTAVVDAIDGRLLRAVHDDQEVDGTGNSVYSGTVTLQTTSAGGKYQLIDPLRGNATTCDLNHAWAGTCTTFTDADNVWGNGNPATAQSAAVDAQYGAANAFDYYKNVLGRNGVFDTGAGVTSRVHRGSAWVNAHWNTAEKVMEYGDGAGDTKPLVSLDVAAHEMTHGVTQALIPPSGLVYDHESGALNEATSDIFGTMAEFYAKNPVDQPDYLIGEKIDINGNGTPLRYMYDPSLDGGSANCWYAGVGNLDVHYSSGVGNHLYFLLAQGSGATPYGTSPTCDNSSLVGIGRDKAAKIWYQALKSYFTADETYADARVDTMAAAAELYGKCSTVHFSVAAAWAAVGIGKPLSWLDCLPRFNLVHIRWPENPIPDPGPLKWVTKIDVKGTLSTIEVGVNITHTRRGDLQLDLVAPDGRSYRLKNADREDRAADVTEVYQVRLPDAAQAGEWTLVVDDLVKGESGQLNGWSLLY